MSAQFLIETITSSDPALRNRPLTELCRGRDALELLAACEGLDAFRRKSGNLYERVRATLFLYAVYRFQLCESPEIPALGETPYPGFEALLDRRFEEAIDAFRAQMNAKGPNSTLLSALAEAYHQLAFQTLANQVRRSVRASRGNRWMFRMGHPEEHPLLVRPEMFQRVPGGFYPVLRESTSVRLDLSHSGWSDIFFLGMDYPECARVLNISVDLGVYGRDASPRPPIESFVRVIEEPLLRLSSVDLNATKDIHDLAELFNFGNDYLSLVKAGVIASGVIPPSMEGTGHDLAAILAQVVGPGMGLELVTKVNEIPKGSRLAVSTNLLGSMISALMRATGQTASIDGSLLEEERRLVASRAILGEWLGGSGGGWQDSGGIWPGIKIIEGTLAREGDPEYGISRGRLLPQHRLLGGDELHPDITERLSNSLVPFHGGMAQNVGPILEMVTEKYLLRNQPEFDARNSMRGILDGMLAALKTGDLKKLGACTMQNFHAPLKTIIPWVSNRFTETIIARTRDRFGEDFWGFLMLGGMSGGGMGMFVAPEKRDAFRDGILEIALDTKAELEDALPFAMDPVVYDFAINTRGTTAEMLYGDDALMPVRYYALQAPELLRKQPDEIAYLRKAELDSYTAQCRNPKDTHTLLRTLIGNLFLLRNAGGGRERATWEEKARQIKEENGFDPIQHEQIREDLRMGRIGLAHNRLPAATQIEDVHDADVIRIEDSESFRRVGEAALRGGRVAVLSLAGGVGSRWTSGAGVIKALNPFVEIGGRHRSFLELHLAKTMHSAKNFGVSIPHIISSSYLTDAAIQKHLALTHNFGYQGPLYVSTGRSICQRVVPMVRDLTFIWEEMPQETLDEQKQKVRDALRTALRGWAKSKGEGSDYVDNLPEQRFSPPGHWYEVPNLLLNGTLARLLAAHPTVNTIMLHNIDTLGADLAPEAVGAHLSLGATLSFEVVPRRIVDRGGGLARVNGRVRLLEGLAQPREEDELKLRYYNSLTTWIEIDALLSSFELERRDLARPLEKIAEAVRRMARRMPTYVTIKDVKWRWGHGQEDVYPVAQFEKLWGDMSALSDVPCQFLAVSRMRGQQLKDPNQLDAWANDGSKEYVAKLAGF